MNILLESSHLELAYKDNVNNVVLIDNSKERPKMYEQGVDKIKRVKFEDSAVISEPIYSESYDIFLSYASEDEKIALELYRSIKEGRSDLDCFMAEVSLKGGDIWTEEIKNPISGNQFININTPNGFKEAIDSILSNFEEV